MVQGWHNDDYLILFEEQLEAISMTARYNAAIFLPGYTIAGLKGWDDFIVRDSAQQFYTVSTVPLAAKHLKPFTFDIDVSALRPDSRLTDKIKWYVQPLVFGGDPQSEQNMTWITLDQHTEAVKWWNAKYRELQ
jgi:hypothetical protein